MISTLLHTTANGGRGLFTETVLRFAAAGLLGSCLKDTVLSHLCESYQRLLIP